MLTQELCITRSKHEIIEWVDYLRSYNLSINQEISRLLDWDYYTTQRNLPVNSLKKYKDEEIQGRIYFVQNYQIPIFPTETYRLLPFANGIRINQPITTKLLYMTFWFKLRN